MTDKQPPRWKVTVHPNCEPTLYARKLHYPQVFKALCDTFDALALEYDPRYPKNPALRVAALQWDAPGWFRVYVMPYNYRAVFRVLERREGCIIELADMDILDEAADGRAIQIMEFRHRARVYQSIAELFEKVA